MIPQQIITILLFPYRIVMYFLPEPLQGISEIVYVALFIIFLIVQVKQIDIKSDFFSLFRQLIKRVALVILILAAIDLFMNLLISKETHITGILFSSINIHIMIVVVVGISTFILRSIKKSS